MNTTSGVHLLGDVLKELILYSDKLGRKAMLLDRKS